MAEVPASSDAAVMDQLIHLTQDDARAIYRQGRHMSAKTANSWLKHFRQVNDPSIEQQCEVAVAASTRAMRDGAAAVAVAEAWQDDTQHGMVQRAMARHVVGRV